MNRRELHRNRRWKRLIGGSIGSLLVVAVAGCGASARQPVHGSEEHFSETEGALNGAAPEAPPRVASAPRGPNAFTVAGFTLDLVGIGGIAAGVAMTAQDDVRLRSSGSFVALGGTIAIIAGTLLTIHGLPAGEDDRTPRSVTAPLRSAREPRVSRSW